MDEAATSNKNAEDGKDFGQEINEENRGEGILQVFGQMEGSPSRGRYLGNCCNHIEKWQYGGGLHG